MGIVNGIDQTAGQRFFRIHPTPCVSELPHEAVGDESGEPLERAYVRGHADVDFLYAEKGVCRAVAGIARGDQIHAAPDASALNGGQNGHANRLQAVEHVLHPVDVAPPRLAGASAVQISPGGAREDGEIHAGAEMLAGGGENERTHVAPGIQLVQSDGQLLPEGERHAVVLVGLVELDPADPVCGRHVHSRVRHDGLCAVDRAC